MEISEIVRTQDVQILVSNCVLHGKEGQICSLMCQIFGKTLEIHICSAFKCFSESNLQAKHHFLTILLY